MSLIFLRCSSLRRFPTKVIRKPRQNGLIHRNASLIRCGFLRYLHPLFPCLNCPNILTSERSEHEGGGVWCVLRFFSSAHSCLLSQLIRNEKTDEHRLLIIFW